MREDQLYRVLKMSINKTPRFARFELNDAKLMGFFLFSSTCAVIARFGQCTTHNLSQNQAINARAAAQSRFHEVNSSESAGVRVLDQIFFRFDCGHIALMSTDY